MHVRVPSRAVRPYLAKADFFAQKETMQNAIDIHAISEKIQQQAPLVDRVFSEMDRVIVGQRYMVERMLIGLICGGHILLEGVPGLAKTLTCLLYTSDAADE